MDPVAIIIPCVIGAVCGFLAGQIVKGHGFGILWNVVIGIVGAAIFGMLFPSLISIDIPYVAEIIGGTIGSVILLIGIGFVKKVAA